MHDGYEYSEPITVYGAQTADQGGSQGSGNGVVLQSPFGAEACEWAVQLIAFEASGKLSISPDGKPPSVGVTNDGGVRGYIFNAPAAEVICPHPVFTPLTNGRLYLSFNINAGANNVTVVFVFRRHKGHTPQFEPMYHTADPQYEQHVNQARAAAVAGGQFPSNPRTR